MHLFTFEPGDGLSYRVLFGRLPSQQPLFAAYTVFGVAEFGDALITVVFTTDQISEDTFFRHWRTATHTNRMSDLADFDLLAWTLFSALVGAPANTPPGWDDWRLQLPAGALG